MCGICGFFGPEDMQLAKRMNSVMFHRGPDDDGFYSDSRCTLAMRRLSIIDVSGGRQPIHNENGDVWVVFNGEIYNYIDLRRKLGNHRFYTNSDTEAIVHAYEEFGDGCVNHLDGMFAFAIWDSRRKRLFLARDRFGEKPLYYTLVGKRLFFASEIKSILQNAEVKRVLNQDALHWYLSFRCNPCQETFFRGIYKLLPGHVLSYDGSSLRVERYWSAGEIRPDYSRPEKSFVDEFLVRLEQSVRERLMSEVPLGAYLSAGIDSASVVALMRRHGPVRTFSVGFSEDSEELKGARQISEFLDTEHKEVIIRPDSSRIVPDVVWHLDEPVADPTCIPIYLLSKSVKPFATVVLTGDGSDELLFGYEQVKLVSLHKRYLQKVPSWTRGALVRVMSAFPKSIYDVLFRYASSLGDKGFDRFLSFARTEDPVRMYLYLVSIFSEEEKRELFRRHAGVDLYRELAHYFSGREGHDDLLINTVRMDESNILAEDMLMRSDKSTMAFSVEQRVPFLDHGLAEFLNSVPPGLKLRGLQDKYILRKSMSGILPPDCVKRKKTRFFTPIHAWFDGELRDISRQLLSREECERDGFFNYRYIENIFKNHEKSRLYYSRQLWALLVFKVWHRVFIEENSMCAPGGFV
ncbi:asparagine synthase (glutamine-hydrolyzing) [Candidatus Woesearchaeota archaeon]|nr:asparagine synthase (glutamine-hydrolyzing) [Candidatus Woesearchaeota archaeon]